MEETPEAGVRAGTSTGAMYAYNKLLLWAGALGVVGGMLYIIGADAYDSGAQMGWGIFMVALAAPMFLAGLIGWCIEDTASRHANDRSV